MNVGDRVQFVEHLGDEPRRAEVTDAYPGTPWVRIKTSDGQTFDRVLAAADRFQSPKGHYCLKDNTPCESCTRD